MPMGLTNAPATFQAFMNHIFQDMTDIFHSDLPSTTSPSSLNSLEEHWVHIRHVLECLRGVQLALQT